MDDFDIAQIDEVIHGRIRLGIMACLDAIGRLAPEPPPESGPG